MQLIAENISKYFADNRIFKNINFQIKSGQSLAIIGPNGSGKSTLIRILSNLIQPTEGKIIYKNTGGEIKKENIYKNIGLVGPYLELYQDLSAKENLTFFSKIKGIRESDKRINDLMKRLKLSGREDDLVKAYSSGMKQRLKYVFAMLGQPDDDLDIETSDDFELSFGYINTGFRMKLNLYRIYFDNKSYRIENPAMADKPGYDYKGRRYVTVGKAVYEGIEFSSNIQLSKNLDLGLSVTSMENAWGDDISEEAQSELGIEEGKIEPGTPQFMLSGVLNYIRGPFFMSASARYNKDYYILPGNDYIALEYDVTNDVSTHSAAVLDDWAVVDLIIGWNQKFMGVDLSASFHLNNLFNEDFYQIGNEYGLIPGPERNAMLNLTIGL